LTLEKDSSLASRSSSWLHALLLVLPLGVWFLSKLRTPTQDINEPISPQDDTTPKHPEREPTVGSDIPPAPTQHYQPDRRKDNTPKWKKWTEIIAVGVGVGLLGINILLWCSTKKAADAAKSAAETGARQLEAFEAAQAAHLVIESFSIQRTDGIWKKRFSVVNRGQSVADRVTIYEGGGEGINQKFDPSGDPFQRANPNWKNIETNMFMSRDNGLDLVGFSLSANDKRDFEQILSSQDSAIQPEIMIGKRYSDRYVVVLYRNIFMQTRTAYDCVFYNAFAQRFSPCLDVLYDIQNGQKK
jgi:hypothetical protein